MIKQVLVLVVTVLAFASCGLSQAEVFFDDFEAYPVSNPSDFSATGNWTHNGVAGGNAGNANRIFSTGNFGGTQLWIAHPDSAGSGVESRGIDVQANSEYEFSAAIVAETFAGARDNEFSVDLLLGADLISASSLLGGPQNVIGRGDGGDGVPADAIDDSYEDQITSIPFSTGAVGAGEQLFIQIVYQGPGPSLDPGFAGVDNVAITFIPEPSTLLLTCVGLLGLVARRRR